MQDLVRLFMESLAQWHSALRCQCCSSEDEMLQLVGK